MGKKNLVFAAVVSLPVIAGVLTYSGALAAHLTVKWSYDYTSQPPCSASREKDCIDHFEILDYTDPQKPKLLRKVANPANAIGKVDNIADEFAYGPPFGLRIIAVVTVARDEKGNLASSNPYAARQDVDVRPKVLKH